MNSNENNSERVIDHLLTKVPVFSSEDLVKNCLEKIRKVNDWDSVNYVYVLDDKKNLIGVVSIKELLLARDLDKLQQIMRHHPVGVESLANQERAAVVAIKNNIKAVPIFKKGTREFLGVVGTDQILDILHHEHVEDMLRFSGIVKEHPTVDIFKVGFFKLFKMRILWLLIGLVGGVIATALVGQFEHVLKKELALSFFIPVVVYISNAVAIQSQILLIRLLSSQKTKNGVFLKRELIVSFLLSLTAALILYVYAYLWLGSIKIAVAVGLAVLGSTLAAVLIAVAIPLFLYSIKKDPALGSGPMATAFQDVSTLLIYFLIASLIIL